jgi:UDP-N-acetyl-D-glucosamine dehydrogenase
VPLGGGTSPTTLDDVTAPQTTPEWYEASLDAIRGRRARIAILGCGYVGLTLAVDLARQGLEVLGIEPDEVRAKELAAGSNPVPDVHLPPGELEALCDSGKLAFEPALERSCDVYVICVPTPLRDGSPDLRYIESAGESVAGVLRRGQLVILESTTYPGTTEELLEPILREGSSLTTPEDFALAYSPERINPGDPHWGLRNTPKVVGGLVPQATELAAAMYSHVCDTVHRVSSPRAAEITKLFENTYREVNIALSNEMAVVCHDFDIDPWEVLEAAASKPFGFTAFRPGPGVGGHCVPIDPQYLAWRVRGKVGRQFRLLETASDINQRMPTHVAQRAGEILNDRGIALRGARILLLGVAYKSGSGDVRESPALRVASRLRTMGAELSYHDPHVESVVIDDQLYESLPLDEGLIERCDIVIVLTDHAEVDYGRVLEDARCVFDTRGVTAGWTSEPGRLYRS